MVRRSNRTIMAVYILVGTVVGVLIGYNISRLSDIARRLPHEVKADVEAVEELVAQVAHGQKHDGSDEGSSGSSSGSDGGRIAAPEPPAFNTPREDGNDKGLESEKGEESGPEPEAPADPLPTKRAVAITDEPAEDPVAHENGGDVDHSHHNDEKDHHHEEDGAAQQHHAADPSVLVDRVDHVPDEIEDLIKARVKDNTIIIIPVNTGYIEFALNLACGLRKLDIHNYVYLSMDSYVWDHFRNLSLPVLRDPDLPFVSSKAAAWGDPHFHQLVCTKLVTVTKVLKMGYRVVLTDADIVWRKNALLHIREDLDMTWSIGSCHLSLKDNYDLSRDHVAKLNTGFYHAHPRKGVIKLMSRAREQCQSSHLTGDQPAINSVMTGDIQSGRIVNDDNFKYTYGFFDGCLFANGCVYFKHLCKKVNKTDPVIVHANFLVGKKDKIKHLKKYDLWDEECIEKVNSAG